MKSGAILAVLFSVLLALGLACTGDGLSGNTGDDDDIPGGGECDDMAGLTGCQDEADAQNQVCRTACEAEACYLSCAAECDVAGADAKEACLETWDCYPPGWQEIYACEGGCAATLGTCVEDADCEGNACQNQYTECLNGC
jgi:hypothetical protein